MGRKTGLGAGEERVRENELPFAAQPSNAICLGRVAGVGEKLGVGDATQVSHLSHRRCLSGSALAGKPESGAGAGNLTQAL